MKNSYSFIYGVYFLFAFLLVVFTIYFYRNCYKDYKIYSALIVNKNSLEFLIEEDSYQKLNKNKKVFIQGKQYHITIQKVVREILVKKGKKFHQVTISLTLSKRYQLLDTISLSIYESKRSLLTIFESCLKGGSYEEN